MKNRCQNSRQSARQDWNPNKILRKYPDRYTYRTDSQREKYGHIQKPARYTSTEKFMTANTQVISARGGMYKYSANQ